MEYNLNDITISNKGAHTLGSYLSYPIILQSSFICMNIFELESNINALIDMSTSDIQFNHMHVDVMDNSYVPRYGMYPELVKQMQDKYGTKLHFHTHIMVDSAKSTIEYFAKYSDILYFHYNSVKHPSAMIDIIHDNDCKAGIVIDRHNLPEDILGIEQYIDAIMIMGINPGVLKNVPYSILIDKIKLFRQAYPTKILAVDGGVTMDSIVAMANAGVNNLTCGSKTLYNSNPLHQNIKEIINKLS